MGRKSKLHYPDHRGPQLPPDNLLVFEGNEEFHTFFALFEANKILEQFHFEPAGGYESLWNDLPIILQQSDLKRIGIVVDADNSPQDRWISLRTRLCSDLCGYRDIPETPQMGGVIVSEEGKPRLGLWLMPDNQSTGALEEFIRFLISPDDILWPIADSVVESLPELPYPDSLSKANWTAKAKLHSWLAWQEQPGQPIGLAITKRFLNPKVSEAQLFVTWLRDLFEL